MNLFVIIGATQESGEEHKLPSTRVSRLEHISKSISSLNLQPSRCTFDTQLHDNTVVLATFDDFWFFSSAYYCGGYFRHSFFYGRVPFVLFRGQTAH